MAAFSTVDAIRSQQIWEGVAGWGVHGEQVTLAVIELGPSAIVPEHSHANEQVGILVEGSLLFRIGSETRTVEPGGTWCVPARVPHAVTAGPEGAVAVEAFSPPRDDWQSLELRAPGRGRWP